MEIGSAFGRTALGGETFNVFDGFLENEAVWDSALGDEDRLLSSIVRGLDQHAARLSAPGSTESHDLDIDTVDWNAIYSAQGLDSPIMSPRYSLQLSGSPNGTTATPPTFRLPWQQTRQTTAPAPIPPAPRARLSLSGATHSQDRTLPVLAAVCNGNGLGSASSASGHGKASLCEPGCSPSAAAAAAWQSSSAWHPSLALATHHTASWFLANNSVAPHADAITSAIVIPAAATAAIAPDDVGRSSNCENGSGGCGGSAGAARPASTPAPTIRPAPIQIPVDVASLAHAMAAAPAAPPSTFPTPGTCSSATASIAMAATPPAVDDGMGVCHSSCADTAATVPIMGPLPLLPCRDSGSIAASAPAACVVSPPPPPPPPQPPAATAVSAGTAASPGKACDIHPSELVPVLSQSSACGTAADFSDGNSKTAAVVEDQSSPQPAPPPPRSPAGGPYGSTPVPPNFAPQPPPLPESLPSPPPGTHARQLARAAAAIAAAGMLRRPPPDLEVMGLLPPGFPQSRLPVLQLSKATTPYQQQQQYSGAARSCVSNGCCDGGCGRNTGAANASWNPVCSSCAYRSGSGGCWYAEGSNRGWQQLAQRQHPYRRIQCDNGYYAGSSVHAPATSPYQRPQCAVPGTGTGYCHSCPAAAALSSQPQHRHLALAAPRYRGHGDEAAALAPAQPAQELSPSCASSGGGHDCSGGQCQQHGGPLQGCSGGQAQGLVCGAVRVVKGISSMEVDGAEAVLRDDRAGAEVAGMAAAARTSSNGGGCIPNDVPRLDATAEVDDNEADLQLLQELLHAPSSGVPSKLLAGSAMAPPPPPHTIWYTSPWRDRPVVLTPAQAYAAPRNDITRGVAVLQTPPPPPYPSPCPSLYGRNTQTVQGPSTCSLPYGRAQGRCQQLEWHFGSRPYSATAPPVAGSPPPDPGNSRCFCTECRRKYTSGSACIQGLRPSGAATSSPALPPPPPPAPTYPPQLPPCPSTPYMSAPPSFSRITLHGAGSATRCILPCCNPSLAAAPPPLPPSRPPPLCAEASPWTQSRCVLPCCNPAVQRRWAGDMMVQGSGPGCSTVSCEGVCNGPGCHPLPSGQGTQSDLQLPLPPAPLPLQPVARRALLFPPVNPPLTAMAMAAPAANSGVPGVHVGTLASDAVPTPPLRSQPLLPQSQPALNHTQIQQLQQPGSRPASISAPAQPFGTDFCTHPYPHLHHQYQHDHHHHQQQYVGMRKTYTGSSLPCSQNGVVPSNVRASGDGGGGCGGCGDGRGGNGGGGEHYFPLPLPPDAASPAADVDMERILSPPSSSYTTPQKPPLPHPEAPQTGGGLWGPEPLAPRPLAAGSAAAAGGLVEGVRCITRRAAQLSPAIVGGTGAAPVALQPQPAGLPSMPVAVYNGGGSPPCRTNWQLAQTHQHQGLLPLPGHVARQQHQQHQQPESPLVQRHIALQPNSQDWHQQHRHPL
ncbi:hypothetical protein Vafri_73 [Volvox africanus]|nr:hypothetical protein Vafri_73 [Volvox africanus]